MSIDLPRKGEATAAASHDAKGILGLSPSDMTLAEHASLT